jgi:hypothetical protein
VLFGEDGADESDERVTVGESDERVTVGEDADDVGAAADFAVEPLLGVVGPDLSPDRFRERGEREDVGAGVVEVFGDRRKLVGQRVEDAVELGGDGVGVGLVIDRVQQRLDPSPGALRAAAGRLRSV